MAHATVAGRLPLPSIETKNCINSPFRPQAYSSVGFGKKGKKITQFSCALTPLYFATRRARNRAFVAIHHDCSSDAGDSAAVQY